MHSKGSFDRHAAADLLAVAVTLAAPVLTAGAAAWPKAVLLLLASGVLWLSPSVRRNSLLVDLAFLGFVLCGGLGFLPLAAFVQFPWWNDLRAVGVGLPGTISAQPWLTLQGLLSLVAASGWAWFLLARDWHMPRRLLFTIFGAGALLILLWWLAAFSSHRNLNGVTTQTAFGSFPNRNQSANFAALAGIVFAALALHGRLHRQRWWGLWLGALLVAVAAVLAAGSRAGLLFLALGIGAWFVWMGRRLRLSAPVSIFVSGALLFAAGLLAFGGPLLKRFTLSRIFGGESAPDLRLSLYRDALPLLGESSWHGVGLGNFAAVFARYRDASVTDTRAIHPDSDWVWLIAELGWLAPLCLGALLWFAFRQCRPFNEGSERVLRSAGLVCSLAFLAHSLFDVPGHRATLLPALFLLGLAASPTTVTRLAPTVLARGVATLMTLAAGTQLVLLWPGSHVQTPESIRVAKVALNRDLDRGDWPAAAQLATEALRIAPLDWELYFGRASAHVMLGADTRPAQADFAVARYLEPNPRVAFDEGVAWLVRESDFVEGNPFIGPRPDLAASAWSNIFARPPRSDPGRYSTMTSYAGRYPEIRPYLRSLAGNDAARLVVFLQVASDAEFREAMDSLLAVSPDLAAATDDQLRRILSRWAMQGDRERLLRELPQQPRWVRAGWVHLGDALVAQGELQRACELARARVAAPDLPPPPGESLDRLRDDFAARPTDLVAGLRYYQSLSVGNQLNEALRVVALLAKNPQAPVYVDWLEADLRERMNDLPGAWTAWRRAGLR